MSSYLYLSEGREWWTAGLFFSTLLDSASSRYAHDVEASEHLRDMSILGNLHVREDWQDHEIRALQMIYTTARESVAGTIQVGPVLNFCGTDLRSDYLVKLKELVQVFELDGRFNRLIATA
jgi:hypothetical protein